MDGLEQQVARPAVDRQCVLRFGWQALRSLAKLLMRIPVML